MTPLLLCPIDFSDQSRTALRYATAIADRVGSRLVVLTVDHPLLVEAGAAYGGRSWLLAEAERELRRFTQETLAPRVPGPTVEFHMAVGEPAAEILRASAEIDAGLIVMSSRGNSGFRKLFFGSTTERVLRETTAPVLVTPSAPGAPATFEEIAQQARRVVAPVDLTPASRQQVAVAAHIAAALSARLVVMHVIEPLRVPSHWRARLPSLGFAQRSGVEEALGDLTTEAHAAQVETLVVYGEPSEEIAKVADVRGASLVVMGLHSSTRAGPRMGSVTYRLLCLSQGLVLAWPPGLDAARYLAAKNASSTSAAR